MATRSALINVMTDAARKAGRKLIRDFGEVEHLQVSRKGPADFVSNADRRAEGILFKELSKVRPRYGFLMEERGVIVGSDTSNRWIVDPLDGTTNFLHGIPHFCVSIALERDGELIAGVIYQPVTDEMYWAEKGTGAHMNDRRLRVSARTDFADCVFATGIPFKGEPHHETFRRQLGKVMAVSAGVRRMGSAALDLAYVAAGRCDGYWEMLVHPWDVAAGIVILREAGGLATDIDGDDGIISKGSIIATNGNVMGPLAEMLRSA